MVDDNKWAEFVQELVTFEVIKLLGLLSFKLFRFVMIFFKVSNPLGEVSTAVITNITMVVLKVCLIRPAFN